MSSGRILQIGINIAGGWARVGCKDIALALQCRRSQRTKVCAGDGVVGGRVICVWNMLMMLQRGSTGSELRLG
jgi:hypothetical protein